MLRFITAAIASTIVSASALALPIQDIDSGDSYYLSLLGENELVSVARVDPSNNRVKIRRKSGYTEWVSPSRLLSYGNSFEEDAATALVGVAIVACLFMPEECQNAAKSSATTSRTRTASTRSATIKSVAVENTCREAVKVRVLRRYNGKWQNQSDWFWTIPAHTTSNLMIDDNNTKLLTDYSDLYFNATSSSFSWSGDESYKYGSTSQNFRKAAVANDGYRYRIKMNCD